MTKAMLTVTEISWLKPAHGLPTQLRTAYQDSCICLQTCPHWLDSFLLLQDLIKLLTNEMQEWRENELLIL